MTRRCSPRPAEPSPPPALRRRDRRGVWSADGDPQAALVAGKIDFTLHGDKLHGGWKLIRTVRQRSGKPQWLLPELARRPLSLLRCPQGLQGQCFLQKHRAASLGTHVRALPIREQDGGSGDYLYVEDVEGVIDLVQMNVIELHPWGAHIEDVEHPDRLVFDLDPGAGVDWKAMVRAARDVRARLQEIGLESFVRLSGGKGLHVVLPIRRGPGWGEVKTFCAAFADAMAAHAPQCYVATASKARRTGVIFIDWLRNGRGATSVASWSLRARKEAGVAMPLAWSELARTRSGADYPLARALRRAASRRKEAWTGWDAATGQKLVVPGQSAVKKSRPPRSP